MDPSNETLDRDIVHTPSVDPITAEIFRYLSIVFKLALNPPLGVAGICTNVINVAVFYRMGLSDGVTQNFFILSISDGLFATAMVINSTAYLCLTFIRAFIGHGRAEIAAHTVHQASLYCNPIWQYISMLITVVIAVVRCCCVAMPLQVKTVVTAKRQLTVIVLLSGAVLAFTAYTVSPMHLFYVHNSEKNTSLPYLRGARWSVYLVFNNIISFGSFIVCIACVIILSISLKKASKFRAASTSGTSATASSGSAPGAKSKESQRSTRVVRVVVLVSVIFIVCNVPILTFYLLRAFLDGFVPGGKYILSNTFTLMVAETFSLLNVTLNMFIYILCNTRYRNIIFIMFGKKIRDSDGLSNKQ